MRDTLSEGCGGGEFHFFGDLGSMSVQRAAENAGESEDVIDLIGVIAAAGGDDGAAGLAGYLGVDLGNGISHGEDDGVRGHGFNHVGVDEVTPADTNEDVGTFKGVSEVASEILRVGQGQESFFAGVEVLAVAGNDAAAIDDDELLDADTVQHAGDGSTGGASATDNE